MSSGMKLGMVVISIVTACVLGGCGEDKNIQTVKNGTTMFTGNIPIGKVLEKKYPKGEWSSFRASNGTTIVEFKTKNERGQSISIQFAMTGGNHFEVVSGSLEGMDLGGITGLALIKDAADSY